MLDLYPVIQLSYMNSSLKVLSSECSLIFFLKKTKKEGLVFWSFIGIYGIFRFLIEFIRVPDDLEIYDKIGYFLGFMTIGQILSVIMIIAAAIGIWTLYRKKPEVAL